MKNIKKQKGITLIALVITIIVMLILVGVTISIALNGKLFGYAKKAVVDTNNQKKAEQELASGKVTINGKEYASIQDYLNNKTQPSEEKLTLVKSWTCSNGGAWSEAIPAGEKVEGDIIANLYKTGNKFDLTDEFNLTEEISLDLYKLVIEGTGRMGTVLTLDSDNQPAQGYAWQKNLKETIELDRKFQRNELDISTVDFSKISDGPFIEAVEIKEGITNIPSGAFYSCLVSEFKMANSINDIGEYAFGLTRKLKSIKLSNSLKTINKCTFWNTGLTSIEIPDSVNTIKDGAVAWSSLQKITIGKNVKKIEDYAICTGGNNFKTVKILIEDYENCEISSVCFGQKDGLDDDWLPEGSTIYVLNEGMKNKLAGTYDPAKTEVKVVTLEEMNAI